MEDKWMVMMLVEADDAERTALLSKNWLSHGDASAGICSPP